MSEAETLMDERPAASSLPPEAILWAIFTQAFAGERITLPPGADIAGLRRAVALDDAVIAGIFQEVRARARTAPPHRAPPPPPPKRKSRAWMALLLALFGLLGAIGVHLFSRRPPPPRTPCPASANWIPLIPKRSSG